MFTRKLTTSEAKLISQRITQDGRYCDPRITIQQIGNLTVMAVSGGRYAEIRDTDGHGVGVILPCGENRAVEVVLGWNDLYTVRRVRLIVNGARRGEVTVETETNDLYFDQLPDTVYCASTWK
jgi:hypothetical protein